MKERWTVVKQMAKCDKKENLAKLKIKKEKLILLQDHPLYKGCVL